MHSNHTEYEIDDLFPPGNQGSEAMIRYADLPYLARPIVEYLHGTDAFDAAVCADSGARFFGRALLSSWHQRYPGTDFPTHDHRIHHVRVTSSAEESLVVEAIHGAFRRAGIVPQHSARDEAADQTPTPRLLFIDDWIARGRSLEIFVRAAEAYGIPRSAITIATMCGNRADGMEHVIGDESRNPRSAEWRDATELIGVSYDDEPDSDGVTPTIWRRSWPIQARRDIDAAIEAYYATYNYAIASGRLALQGAS